MNLQPNYNIYRANSKVKTEKQRLKEVFDEACDIVYKYYPKSFARLFDNKGDTEEVFYRRTLLYLIKSKDFKYKDILSYLNSIGHNVKLHHLTDANTTTLHWILFAPKSERSLTIKDIEENFNKSLTKQTRY